MRVFIALQLKDKDVKEKITDYQRKLVDTGAELKLVASDLLHITLKFLGEIDENQVSDIAFRLRNIKARPFSVEFNKIGAFPSQSRINVVWAGSSQAVKELEDLGIMVNNETKGIGDEQKSFMPHITLARVKGGRNIDLLRRFIQSSNVNFGTAYFDEFQLKKSVLTPQGPIYSDVEVYRLVS